MTDGVPSAVASRLRRAIAIPAIGTSLAIVGCAASTEGSESCLEELDLECTPAYEPSYDAIYENLLSKTCGAASTGSVCHYGPEASSAQGGLALSDPEESYDGLLGRAGSHARVKPGEPECSTLVQRLESDDPAFRMPVGQAALTLAERCAVRQWIANGAQR
jgi:hypothetical protein